LRRRAKPEGASVLTRNLIELRNQLATRLAHQIGDPAVEAKELRAFDLLVGRRQFLKAAGLGTLAALVGVVTA